MKNRHQFEAEIAGRRVTAGFILSAEIVVAVIGWHTPKDCEIAGRQETSKVFFVVPSAESPYEYVLVMSCGERSLHDACAKERIAGIRLRDIKGAARCIALLYARTSREFSLSWRPETAERAPAERQVDSM